MNRSALNITSRNHIGVDHNHQISIENRSNEDLDMPVDQNSKKKFLGTQNVALEKM